MNSNLGVEIERPIGDKSVVFRMIFHIEHLPTGWLTRSGDLQSISWSYHRYQSPLLFLAECRIFQSIKVGNEANHFELETIRLIPIVFFGFVAQKRGPDNSASVRQFAKILEIGSRYVSLFFQIINNRCKQEIEALCSLWSCLR